MGSHTEHALRDINDGIKEWRLWSFLAWNEIHLRYRRTVLGPFWQTLSTAIFVGALGVIYSTLWKVELRVFLPYLCAGFLSWVLLSSLITDGCQVFIAESGMIHQKKLPYTLYVFKMVLKNIYVFLHSLPVYIVIVLIFGLDININTLLFIPFIIVVSLNGVWIALFLGLLSARFRDVPLIVSSVLMIVFLVTPIIWSTDQLGVGSARSAVVDANPFYHFIQILRAPLMGELPGSLSVGVCLSITAVGLLGGFLVFRKFRNRIPYWL